MKVLMPFWRLENFDRYIHQISSIAKRIEELHITYISGTPKKEWKKFCTFHQLKTNISKNFVVRWLLNRRLLWKQVRNIDVDLYWGFSGWWTQEFCYDCSRRMGKPYVIDLRGNYVKELEAKKVPWLKRFISNYLKLKCLRKADLIIPISNKMKLVALDWGVDKNKISDIVTRGLDTEIFKPLDIERKEKLTVGFSGRLSPEKGVEILIKIMNLMPETDFLVAGEKQMEVDFPENCNYLGKLPFDKMPIFYNKVDVIVVPSKFESFGFVFLETYACGKPLITTKNILPINLPIYGFALENPNIYDYVKSIKQIRDITSLKKANYVRKYVERTYSWDSYGEKMIKIFNNILTKR